MTIMEAAVAVVAALMGLLGTVITGALVPYLRSRMSEQDLWKARQIAEFAVAAVEQLAPESGAKAREKFDDAMGRAYELARTHGIDLSAEEWRTLIEQAVYEMNRAAEAIDVATSEPAALAG